MRTIKFITNYENLISRLPGLFAYTELDDKNVSVLHKSTDSLMGCYGKIVENIKYEDIDNIHVENIDNILITDNVYTYKELMSIYYQYINKEERPSNFDTFINFIEYGIGKIQVPFDKLQLSHKENDLVPDFIYLTTVKTLYGELLKLRDKCEFYKQHKETKEEYSDIESEKQLCCIYEMYKRRGGDNYLSFLKENINEAEKRSNLWWENANKINNKDRLSINYSINLFSSIRDNGLLTPTNDIENKNDIKTVEITLDNINTDSKLKSLRRYSQYLDEFFVEQRPQFGYDWLYYYRVGQICNLSTLNDEFGNIQCYETDIKLLKEGDEVTDLLAFGDYIEKIEIDKTERKLTFTYWTDVHLNAKVKRIEVDDDGNKKICYDDFIPDKDYFKDPIEDDFGIKNFHGIKYQETYYYDIDSELNDIDVTDFNKYVNGSFDRNQANGEDIKELKLFEKYEFSLNNNKLFYQQRISNKDIKMLSVTSELSTKIIRENVIKDEDSEKGITKLEFYDGVSYSPTEILDVNIDRGLTSIFDRHIRFSEVNTLNDMTEYANGSFFIMKE